MQRYLLAFLALSTASLLACGGSQPSANPPAAGGDASAPADTTADAGASGDSGSSGASTPSNSASADAGAPSTAAAESPSFGSLPKNKQAEIMATKVVPDVGKVFKEYDAKKFEKVGCGTCHGRGKHQDPHSVLPKLTFSNGGFEKLAKSKPEMMKFMGEKVLPAMAAAMGEKPFDPATKKGFGCGGCHAID